MTGVIVIVGVAGVVASFAFDWVFTLWDKRGLFLRWAATIIVTTLCALLLRPPLLVVFAMVIFLPWVWVLRYLAESVIFRKRIRLAREQNEEKWRQEKERKEQESRARKAEDAVKIEIWARKLCQLTEASSEDLYVGKAEAREIGEEICSRGGFALMQQVAYRVRAMEKEQGNRRVFAVQAVERWWDGIGGWRA